MATQKSNATSVIRSMINSTVDQTFEKKITQVNGEVQKFVNNKIKDFFTVMFNGATLLKNSGVAPEFVSYYGDSWKPLNLKYIKQKRNSIHYINKGSLAKVFPSYINRNKKNIPVVLGGYKAKSAKLRYKRDDTWLRYKTKTFSWSFEVFDRVYLRKLNAESLLDRLLPEMGEVTAKGKIRFIKPSTKFGLHPKSKKPTIRYHRRFLYNAIRYFQKYTLEESLKRKYPVTVNKR